jgi:RND superfamily putative drug exporter
MFFADFGKFSNSGPAIGLCLAVTLVACVTLAPAMLRALGPLVFWPFGVEPNVSASDSTPGTSRQPATRRFGRFWEVMADTIVRWPGLILVSSVLIMLPAAIHGCRNDDFVTYDFLRQLPSDRASKTGAEVMAGHFPVGEGAPMIILAYRPDARFDTDEGKAQIQELTTQMYVEGVTSVRSITDPLGDYPPWRRVGLFKRDAWVKRAASSHPRTEEIFVASQGQFSGRVTRVELILKYDPFSLEASEVLNRVEQDLHRLRDDPQSPWHGATFAFSGITAGIRDLKLVTRSDNRRIQLLVVLAVLAVLLVILRRPLVCLYMIATVLFSYFVTIGATQWFFAWTGGAEYQGLDWKVPLFLFVILVAIGQDYNVYLATRVFEEQRRLGVVAGLKHAVIRTGGIITSCGVIMAGTFIAMTSGAWHEVVPADFPVLGALFRTSGGALPAIVQLGFALALGVILDTFVIRPILVPAFLALLAKLVRWRHQPPAGGPPQPKMKSSPVERPVA